MCFTSGHRREGKQIAHVRKGQVSSKRVSRRCDRGFTVVDAKWLLLTLTAICMADQRAAVKNLAGEEATEGKKSCAEMTNLIVSTETTVLQEVLGSMHIQGVLLSFVAMVCPSPSSTVNRGGSRKFPFP